MLGALVAVLVASQAHAQPAGMFDCGDDPPAWVRVCTIADWDTHERFVAARQLSEARGIQWLLQAGFAEPVDRPIGPHMAAVRARLDAAGLVPHLGGMSIGEEWYERLGAGEFANFGCPTASLDCVRVVHGWLGEQHAAAYASLPVPVVWITTLANNDLALHGPAYYRPVPASTHVVALDAYVHVGGTFAQHVAPVLAHAETTTDLPLVLIPPWFWIPGDPLWGAPPTLADAWQYRQWAQRPRWIATVGFTGLSRPWAGIVGLADLPDLAAHVATWWGR